MSLKPGLTAAISPLKRWQRSAPRTCLPMLAGFGDAPTTAIPRGVNSGAVTLSPAVLGRTARNMEHRGVPDRVDVVSDVLGR